MEQRNDKSAVERLIEYFGSQAKLAAALEVSQPTVSGWLRGKHSPSLLHALRAEMATGGCITAAELCPGLEGVAAPAGAMRAAS